MWKLSGEDTVGALGEGPVVVGKPPLIETSSEKSSSDEHGANEKELRMRCCQPMRGARDCS